MDHPVVCLVMVYSIIISSSLPGTSIVTNALDGRAFQILKSGHRENILESVVEALRQHSLQRNEKASQTFHQAYLTPNLDAAEPVGGRHFAPALMPDAYDQSSFIGGKHNSPAMVLVPSAYVEVTGAASRALKQLLRDPASRTLALMRLAGQFGQGSGFGTDDTGGILKQKGAMMEGMSAIHPAAFGSSNTADADVRKMRAVAERRNSVRLLDEAISVVKHPRAAGSSQYLKDAKRLYKEFRRSYNNYVNLMFSTAY